ncbi:MAG: 1-deoxy-D-xylulose-5-phosphate reductoisomerase [Gemmatimonadales bacterium]|nr:MAG: 1-deoxy-D-xylulose-5-phosphate reductoisomerase [Gemmatimonadales bacterium]
MIRVAILGSTGSIGRSTLAVLARHPDRFRVAVLTARRSAEELRRQETEFSPRRVVLADPDGAAPGAEIPGTWETGRDALLSAAEDPEVDVVVNALVGFAGLEPTLRALAAGKRVALANKESLVAGGSLVRQAMEEGGGELVPVDSEHSAILQCMNGAPRSVVERLVLTASGGPFRGWPASRLQSVGPEAALSHPTWDMGAKISIDSASLANKALEVIEAHVLYRMPFDRIGTVVHPQSIVHSFVEFVDGSVMAQLGFPTMEIPILYALSWPDRIADPELRTFDPVRSSPLTFEEIDHEAFPLFGVGVAAGRSGGVAPAVFNAANEVAVQAFLGGRLDFPGLARVAEFTLERLAGSTAESVEDLVAVDTEARGVAAGRIERGVSPSVPGGES